MQISDTKPTSAQESPVVSAAPDTIEEPCSQRVKKSPPIYDRERFFDTLFQLLGISEEDEEDTAIVKEVLRLIEPPAASENFVYNFSQENLIVGLAFLGDDARTNQ